MPQFSRLVGIDVAKDRLDVVIAPAGERLVLGNDPAGFSVLLDHVRDGDAVGCEASGGYEAPLLLALSQAGRPVWCLHPSDVRAFARLRGRRAKTDPLDAATIAAALAVAVETRPPAVLDAARQAVRETLAVRRNLIERQSGVKALIGTVHAQAARAALQAELVQLEALVAQLDAAVAAALRADAVLAARAARLMTVPGIGPGLAAELIASLPELGALSGGQAASLVGVAPHPRQSGGSGPRGRCQGGRSRLRRVLYMAALAARRCNPDLRRFADRLTAAGKPAKVVLVAVMRKLVVTANAMIRDGMDWAARGA